MHHADHLLPLDLHCCTSGEAVAVAMMQPTHSCERLLSNEVAYGEKSDCGFFTVFETTVSFARPF